MLDQLLSNPLALLLVCGVGAIVISFNLVLVGLLRGDRREQRVASKWGKALTGGQEGRRKQDAQLSALREAVKQLEETARPDAKHD